MIRNFMIISPVSPRKPKALPSVMEERASDLRRGDRI